MTLNTHLTLRLITVLTGLITALCLSSAQAIEEPAYTVQRAWEDPNVEIRAYAPRIMAVTEMDGSDNAGFRVLAGYIFGGNETEQEIAMTAPVQQSMSGADEMAFMMPAQYQLEDLPNPSDPRVVFREAPTYTAAVIRFSGWVSAEKADGQWQTLRRFLIEEGIEISGEPTLNRYNPPWTLPFMRRNEIIVPISLADLSEE